MTGVGTSAVDLAGAFVIPGLIDVHGFHGMSTENRVYCELKGTFWEPTEEEILEDLRVCAEEYPADLEWFIAEGFTPSPMSKETLSAAFSSRSTRSGTRRCGRQLTFLNR